MSDEAPSLDDLLALFAADEGAHTAVLAVVDQHARIVATLEPVSIDEALRLFGLDEHQARVLAADPGLVGDLEVFLSRVLSRIDPSLRALFPAANAFLEAAAAGVFPGGGLVVHLLLSLAEGPCFSLLETWLASRAKAIEAAERDA